MEIIDSHTHRQPPYPPGVVDTSARPELIELYPEQPFSIGVHPWYIPADPYDALKIVEKYAPLPQVVAIGEAGLDTCCATPMWLQIKAFRRQAEIAEVVRKPLIVHSVRTASEVAHIRHEMRATTPWILHGFRGKPTILSTLLKAGFYISYGEHYNTESLKLTPAERILAETDESTLTIEEIIGRLSQDRAEDLTAIITYNCKKLFTPQKIESCTDLF